MRRLVLSFLFLRLTLSTAEYAQSIPPIKAKTLADTDIVLPQPGRRQIVILALGFSHKGGEKCAPWGKRLSTDFQSEAHVTYYQLPVLQCAPSLVRPMILRGMRKDLPAEQQAHFNPILDHEENGRSSSIFPLPTTPTFSSPILTVTSSGKRTALSPIPPTTP
jgi:hypothetical protein